MIAAQVPELADGGFWVVTEVTVEPESGVNMPAGEYPAGFTAQYLDDGRVLARSPQPPLAPAAGISPSISRHYGRIGGL